MAGPTVIMPTEEEDAEINRGIAEDPDTVEWTAEMFAASRPAAEVMPDIVAELMRRRGPQRAPLKVPVSVRLDADIVAAFRNGGPGWQTRINQALRRVVEEADRTSTGALVAADGFEPPTKGL